MDAVAPMPCRQQIQTFLAPHQSIDSEGTCWPTGTTGSWNAASGASKGYEAWSVDLTAFAGKSVRSHSATHPIG